MVKPVKEKQIVQNTNTQTYSNITSFKFNISFESKRTLSTSLQDVKMCEKMFTVFIEEKNLKPNNIQIYLSNILLNY